MGKSIYLFNPENDLALANGKANFCAPLSARTMAEDLSLLPLWYAKKEGYVLSHYNKEDKQWNSIYEKISFPLEFKSFNSLKSNEAELSNPKPWGWSAASNSFFKRRGIPESSLPTQENIDAIRRISHRSTAYNFIYFLQLDEDLPFQRMELPQELHNKKEIYLFTDRHPYSVFKAPWSGSGKGLFYYNQKWTKSFSSWSDGVIARQGSVIAEQYYQREADFALEFYCYNKRSKFVGYSMFRTRSNGAYKGNLLATNIQIEALLASYIDFSIISTLKKKLVPLINSFIAPYYNGYLGVDMMIYRNGTQYFLHPCVEVNVRMNMGVVARVIKDFHMREGSQGFFYIDYFKDPASLYEDHLARMKQDPIHIQNGKIMSGYCSLNPILKTTHYRARIEVNSYEKEMTLEI